MLDTEYSNKHTLQGAGIENRQAAIRVRPKVSDEDAHRTMKIIMAIRGLDKKKHIKEWEEERLSVMPKKMKMQGIAQNWRKSGGKRR